MKVRVESLSWRGLGIAQVEGRPLVVPGTDAGEWVQVALATDARGRRYGALEAVIEPSPHRVDPACAQAARCPGCPLRHLAVARQQQVKVGQHLEALERLGHFGRAAPPGLAAEPGLGGALETDPGLDAGLDSGLDAGLDSELDSGLDPAPPGGSPARRFSELPIDHLPAPPADGHRARARARPVEVAGRLRLGMQGLGDGVALADCPAQSTGSRDLLALLESQPAAFALDEIEVEGDLTDGQVVLTGAPAAVAQVVLPPSVTVLTRTLGPRGPSRPRHVAGPPHGWLEVEGDHLRFTAPGWRPQSPLSLPALRAAVVGALAGANRLLEVGCGAGTLSLPLARGVGELVGLDLERASVDDATFNARHLANARFRVGEADHTLRRLLAGSERFDHALLHAMRRPFGPEVLPRLRPLGVERVLYLAPSAAALARDLADAPGWRVERLAFLDQLPGTVHLLTLASLVRA